MTGAAGDEVRTTAEAGRDTGRATAGIGRWMRTGAAAVLLVAAGTMLLGYLQKRPCATGDWGDGRQYRLLCYSDIVPLYGTERLNEGKVPYLSADNEYPVLTGMTMWVAAQPARAMASSPAGEYSAFFHWNVAILGALGLATAAILYRLVGMRALFFAAAPTLLVYGFVNWDLLAVALATAGLAAFLRARDRGAGLWLGLGATAKLYPGLLAVPLLTARVQASRIAGAIRLAAWAGFAWLAANLPFAIAASDNWSTFFRFNAERPADWDSAWFLLGKHGVELSTAAVNLLSTIAFIALAALAWFLKTRREPGFPAWSFAFPLVVLFLLASKVYSPQYGLWLLPLFALALPHVGLFAAFQVTDMAVFVTRFRFFGDPLGRDGAWFDAFEVALILRGLVLVACLAWWLWHPADRRAEGVTGFGGAAAAS